MPFCLYLHAPVTAEGDDVVAEDGVLVSVELSSGHLGSGSHARGVGCLLYTSPSPRDRQKPRMPSSA